jgi:hypothetical protein
VLAGSVSSRTVAPAPAEAAFLARALAVACATTWEGRVTTARADAALHTPVSAHPV